MYISNLTQPDGHPLTRKISSNHRLSPCAKAIGALLLILSSTAAWGNVDAVKKTPIQEIENTEDPWIQQQILMMQNHDLYLRTELAEVRKKLDQHTSNYIQSLKLQEVSDLENKKWDLERQIEEQNTQWLLLNPQLPPSPSTNPTPSAQPSKKGQREIIGIDINVAEVVEIAEGIPEFIKHLTETQPTIHRVIATATQSEIAPLLLTNLLMALPTVKEKAEAEILRTAQIKALQQNIDKLNDKEFLNKKELREKNQLQIQLYSLQKNNPHKNKKLTKHEGVTTPNKVVEDVVSAEVNNIFTEIDQLGQAVFSNISFAAQPEVSAAETVKNESENQLGSTSTNVIADRAPTHEGSVDYEKIQLRLKQKAVNSVLNGSGSLQLRDNAEAFNTLVDTDDKWAFFALNDESQAYTTTIRKGTMLVGENATASKTFVGLTEEENKQQPVIPRTTIKMRVYDTGKAKETTVGMHGIANLGGSGIMEKTHIRKGGELVVIGDDKPTLSDTTVEGTLELDMSDVTLNGKTVFLPGSVLKGKNYNITNNGDIIFKDTGGIITVYSHMDGYGSLTIYSPAETLTLRNGAYTYQGQTNIQAGTLQIQETYFYSSPIISKSDAELILSNSTLNTKVNGVRMTIDGQSIWRMAGDSSVAALNISENSQIHLNSGQVGNKLAINGDYSSEGGTLTFNSKLEGDDSETDSMLVKGNTSGHTKVKINNLGGQGAKTDLGILLIEVRGLSDGDFTQDGRNVAGAYEYFLRRGSEGDRNQNWYMISDASQEKNENMNPRPEVKGSEEQENPLRESIAVPLNKAVNKNAPQKTYQPVYRPENGSYIANLSMARNLFASDLDNRSGNYKYKDAATGEWRTSSMWIQTQGGIKQFGKTVDQLNIKGKYYSVQLGGDVAKWDIGTQGSGRIGMLAGMGKATNHSKSNITGYYSNGSVNGYNLGVYATWLTDQQNKTGLYIDTLAQYSWFNNAVNGQELAEEKYKSSGFTSSIESGYTFNIGSTEQLSYFIQPNAKITWVGINAQTHTATNKDIINYTNRGQLITRIGAKTYLQTTNNSEQQFMPFIAINWLHQNHNTGTQFSGQGVENSSKNSAEFKIGVESKIDQRLHAWANINHQIGNYNTSDTNALVGIKYAF
ncbi:autotransporter outer membrane beta-barrel domain-containing protein [Yersinia enterocolitica]|uniref:autotransporter outer membrane beta-barrel domain-containing protein n=1 Tax=Yersinia enterocolitica TaxID=630 RepID=UPI0032FA56CD|nr:autotransporter outer membrane beta-barrel domain-containing protein [Yersinia enterocolitica]HDL6983059.1 autotransporter outer membrane beta-barrel domain-containing protein [Yersinia enterocolitica]HDL7064759.1 autotransporter outer membrane beta-barrel domain-containing protein [Yersinia enterocolitica]HDL7069143.1 autotransporter outer membrane beta-barrel domain-containing protein [Yersinia enterocolitica]HDL8128354.1 autotransporter outer membrane beta-barrel domain-containing protein